FFASLPPLLRERGLPHQLLVTSSYDLALEQAFLDAGEEFDVVYYIAAGRNRGRFCHVEPDGRARVIDLPNTYATELSLERRTVILKLHGGVDARRRPARGAARRLRRSARKVRRTFGRGSCVSVVAAPPVSPYKGLAPFEDSELDALLFFGRERECEVIVANLLAAKLTVLYG